MTVVFYGNGNWNKFAVHKTSENRIEGKKRNDVSTKHEVRILCIYFGEYIYTHIDCICINSYSNGWMGRRVVFFPALL